jgi:hypothetical protein
MKKIAVFCSASFNIDPEYNEVARTFVRAASLRGYGIVTGGTIKLTRTMQEREHTLEELHKLEKVRNFLLSEGAYDIDGFYDLIQHKR